MIGDGRATVTARTFSGGISIKSDPDPALGAIQYHRSHRFDLDARKDSTPANRKDSVSTLEGLSPVDPVTKTGLLSIRGCLASIKWTALVIFSNSPFFYCRRLRLGMCMGVPSRMRAHWPGSVPLGQKSDHQTDH